MRLSLECQQCAADFELELSDLIKDPADMVCPNCGIKANPTIVEAFATSLDEALDMAAKLYGKFHMEFSMDADDLDIENQESYDDEDSLWANDIEDDDDELED